VTVDGIWNRYWIYWQLAYITLNFCVFYSLSVATASNRGRFFSFPSSGHLVSVGRAEHLSTDNSTDWVPGWRPFHTTHLVFSSQADLQVTTDNWTLSPTKVKVKVMLRPTVSTHLGLTTRYWLLSNICGFVDFWRPLLREDGSAVCNCYWPSPAQSFSGPSPVGLVAIFYCLRFETSLFVASYDSQGHGGGIRPRLHTGFSLTNQLFHLLITPRYELHRKHHLHCYSPTIARPLSAYPLPREPSFTEYLPSGSPFIVDMFTGRYLATHIPSRDRCVATATQVTI
jgi:hypothetical protein